MARRVSGVRNSSARRARAEHACAARASPWCPGPDDALTPHLRIGRQLTEGLLDRGLRAAASAERSARRCRASACPTPRRACASIPHELSGGKRQRVAIAMALMAARAADRRRADDGTRRHRPGAGARSCCAGCATGACGVVIITHDLGVVAGHRGPRGGDVRRAHRRNRADAPNSSQRPPSVRRGPAGRGAASAGTPQSRLVDIAGRAAEPADRPPGCDLPRAANVQCVARSRRVPSPLTAICRHCEAPRCASARAADGAVACHAPLHAPAGCDERSACWR